MKVSYLPIIVTLYSDNTAEKFNQEIQQLKEAKVSLTSKIQTDSEKLTELESKLKWSSEDLETKIEQNKKLEEQLAKYKDQGKNSDGDYQF